ncbi:hypothetical protein EYB33_19855 [Lysinibacillus sphaericus]|uniref:hypothetical protein n=1 Tax=Lysinibacillus sphaericus TaxID=1421 RepID=UPI001E60D35E|nr:hypothetical protein [Lysinibacillus sphaericus]UDK98383.1 hypothetical protein EYB33_19855 [Lysinibacillus sphaericus]
MKEQRRKPPVSFQEKIEWLKHDSRFQIKMAEIEMNSRKIDKAILKTEEEIANE